MTRPKRAGFTTLELLLAISLLALIATFVVQGLQIGKKTWLSARARDADLTSETAAHALTVMFEKILPVAATNGQSAPVLVFEGNPHALSFVYSSRGETQWGGQILARIGFDPEKTGKVAIWTSVYRPENAWTTPTDRMLEADLLSGVADLEFRYFGQYEAEKVSAWRSDWNNARRLPQLIGVRLRRILSGRSRTIEFVAALRQS